MTETEKEIRDELQYLEDIVDNLKADLEIMFDDNYDMKLRKRAYRSSYYLIYEDLSRPYNRLHKYIRDLGFDEDISEENLNEEDYDD